MRLHANDERLTPKETREFKDALYDAFNQQDLDNMLLEQLGWQRTRIIIADNFDTIILKLIQHTENISETREFLAAALIERQRNGKLLALATRFGLTPPWEQYLSSSQALPSIETSSPSTSQISPPSPTETTMSAELPELSGETFDVFLCHNNKDKPEVKQVALQLRQRGLKPWLDEWEIRPGLSWQRVLEEQIEQINTVAVFIGKDGIGPWQHVELDAYLRKFVSIGCPVIPVLLKDAPEQPTLPIFLQGMQWVDFRKTEPEPLKQLLWGITGVKPDGDSGSNNESSNSPQNAPAIEFSLPESLMNVRLQRLLLSKLDKPGSNNEANKQEPIELDEIDLKDVASRLSTAEFLLLEQEYLRVAKDEITGARKPFDGGGNLRLAHFSHAIDTFDVINACLRNLSILLNTVAALPNTIALVRLDITVRSDQVVEDLNDFRQDMEKCKGRSLNIKKRIDIRNRFVYLTEELEKIAQYIQVK